MAIKVQNTTVIDDSRNIANAEAINGITLGVKKPSIISPTDGFQTIESTITFQSSPFRFGIGSDTHASSDWEVATDSGFSNIIASSIDDTTNLTSFTVSGLSINTYFVRVRYSGATLGDSEYSNTVSFSIASQIAYAWGGNFFGRLGDGTTTDRSSPVTVTGNITNWSRVSAGQIHTGGITTNGIAYAWGINYAGQVGDNTTTDRSSPVTVTGSITNWDRLSFGEKHSLGLTSDGVLYAWGGNGYGELGDGTTTDRSSPVTVAGNITDWSRVFARSFHNLGLTSDGVIYAWGGNYSGALGDGTTTNRSSPVTVAGGITDWTDISSGSGSHNLALTSAGVLYAWGNNSSAELGDGTTTDRSSPVTVAGSITNWSQVSAGNIHSLGLTSDGVIYAWGGNNNGALGDGTTTGRSSPVTVIGGITDWTDISSSYAGGYAIRSNGELYAWGENGYGKLGDGTTTDRSSPVNVIGGLTNWTSVDSFFFHVIGLHLQ